MPRRLTPILIVATSLPLACSFAAPSSSPATPVLLASPSSRPTASPIVTPTASPSPTPSPSAEVDPCSLLTVEEVADALGEPVGPAVLNPGWCLFSARSSPRSVSLFLYQGQEAREVVLEQLAVLSSGCPTSLEFSPDETSTPLPESIQQLAVLPLADLFRRHKDLYAEKCGAPDPGLYREVAGLGEFAYLQVFELFVKSGAMNVVQGEYYFAVALDDPEVTLESALGPTTDLAWLVLDRLQQDE